MSSDYLEKQNKELMKQLQVMSEELRFLREQNQYLIQQLFGSKKESINDPNQLDLLKDDELFNCPEQTGDQSESGMETVLYTRKKSKGQKKEKLSHLPVREIVHDVEECTCPTCAQEMNMIGTEVIREEVHFVPAIVENHRHIRKSYACPGCEKTGETTIVKAPVPKAPLHGSYASASLIAETIYQKFQLKTPTYRQEAHWKLMGFEIPRKNIANWHIKTADYYFEPMAQLLKEKLLDQKVLHADETPFKVLDNQRSKDYVWLFSSGKYSEQPIYFYHHGIERSYPVLDRILGKYEGYVHSDGYDAYGKLPKATSVACLAHIRRKFFEAMPKKNYKDTISYEAVQRCDELFKIEKTLAELSIEERYEKRLEKLKPKLKAFFNWIKTHIALPKTKLGKALSYTITFEEKVMNILKDGRLVLSNNLAERGIKALVMGRKNWLFSATTQGARANAAILSLLETAKANGLNPRKYVEYLLNHLPNQTIPDLEAYLPWNKTVQEECR